MSGKRKRSKRREEEKLEEEEPQEEEEIEEIAPKGKKPKASGTLKEKILSIVENSETLISLQKLKKELVVRYGLANNKAFNTNVNKVLKALLDSNDENFGKIGGSYHGGVAPQSVFGLF